MKKFLKVINKKVIIGFTSLVAIVLVVIAGLDKSYALDTKVYTRKQMQEMLVSTALSLYYNNYFSDYGQTAMDSLGIEGNYFNYGTFLWRDLNISPEEVGYSKYYHIDCSGYNFLIYKNTIGYDMSEYNTVNRYLIFYQDRANYPLARVSFYSGSNRLKYYKEAYTRFGYGWNSGFLGNVSRKISDNCKNTACTQSVEHTEPFVYNNLDNEEKTELVYYFDSTGMETPPTLKEVKAAYAIAEAGLQPGDIISYTKYDVSADDTSGHVMFYAGDDIMTSTEGESGFTDLLLHSTGNGGGDYTTSVTSVNNKLRKETSIIDSSAAEYIDGTDGRFESVYNAGDYILRIAIFRPLNTICTDDNTCKISNNSYNSELTETQLKNNEARVALKKNQVQQYMILEKKYNSSLTPTSTATDGYTRNIISEYNSVNVGDTVIYKLRLRNKLDNTETTGIRLEAEIPENAIYVADSCTDNCTVEGNKLIWENISISGANVKNDITFKVIPTSEGTMTFNGYKVITPATKNIESKELQMSDLNLTIEPTQNGINKELLLQAVNDFQTLVNRGQINYVGSGTHEENIKSLTELLNDSTQTATVSGFGYVKMMYYNAFGLDLDMLTGKEAVIGSSNIKNAIFTNVPYPERNNFLSKVDGEYPLYTGDTSVTIYARKLSSATEELTGAKALISKMLVPGLYGGKHLKGNDLGDRTKFLRSFYNNSAYQSDLEIGDIIISYTSDASSIKVYLYLGDDEYGPILTRFTSTTSTGAPLFLYHTDQYLTTYYQDENLRTKTINKPSNQILNELFSKDLFVVLRPSKLGTTVAYDYNGGIKGTESYVAYNTYKNLVTPIKENSTLTLEFNNANITNVNNTYTSTHEFIGWCTDTSFNNCITNDSALVTDEYHTLYAKWTSKKVTLPTLLQTGYTHLGWYSDSSLTNKVDNAYTIENTTTLYAKWKTNSYSINYNANGGTGTMNSQNIEYNQSAALTKNTYTRTGYTFNGWNTKSDGTGITYSDIATIKNLSAEDGTIINLYAQWIPNTYEIKLDSNGGTGTMNSITATYDENITLPKNQFVKDDYEFISWNTKSDGTGTTYANQSTIKNLVSSGSITLYAIWNDNFSFTINEYEYIENNNLIDKIPVGTLLDDYKKNIEITGNYTLDVALGEKTTIFTGSKTRIYSGSTLMIEFTNIIRGDVNGDGAIKATDYVKVKNHILNTNVITDEVYMKAADANQDNIISAVDYVRIKNIILAANK